MKIWKPLALSLLLVVLILLIIILKDKLFNFEEKRIKSEYAKSKNKTIVDMTETEWNFRNKYKAIIAKEKDTTVDTVSYHLAIKLELEKKKQEIRESLVIISICGESKLIEAFHQMMEFNMPYDRYDKNKITVQKVDNCTIQVNVTTHEPKYGLKTFWIFEVSYDFEIGKYKLHQVKKEFMG